MPHGWPLLRLRPEKRSGSHRVRWSGRKLQRLREAVLAQEPLCRTCKARGLTVAAKVIDHIVPLSKGGTYERSNLQPLCDQCHRDKSRADMGARVKSCDTNGYPLDPNHPWNRE